jgi:hypothetical protein
LIHEFLELLDPESALDDDAARDETLDPPMESNQGYGIGRKGRERCE